MEDWKDIIKNRIEKHRQRDTEIQAAIIDVVSELKNAPYSLKADFEKIDRHKLVWKILIEQKTFEISEHEISEVESSASDTMDEDAKKKVLKDAIITLFLRKFNYHS